MQQATESRTVPIHLWIVGILSLLWNGYGCFNYLMTRQRNVDYVASMAPRNDAEAVFAWVDSFPMWAQFGWGLGVWLGLLGSILLLIRNRWSVHAFALSLLGAVIGLGYQMANPLPGNEGAMAVAMPIMIILVCLGLFLYARAQRTSGVLR